MVLLVSYSGGLGGAERLLLDVAGSLEHDCVLACPEGPLSEAARAQQLTVFPVRRRSAAIRGGLRDRLFAAPRLLSHAREVARLVRALEPELVVAWGMRSAIASLLLRRLPCPVAFQHNDLLPGAIIGPVVRAAATRATLVTAPSRAVASDLDPSGGLGRRLQVIPPGVDVDRFLPGEPARPPEVVMLGALTHWKRPQLALEACALARRRQPDLRIRLVGAPLEDDPDGERLLAALQERAARSDLAGAVDFVGAVADTRPELARATCLLHCATREPFGVAVLEALAAGRPAVVPAAAGPAEIVDESCGFLYPPGEASAAAGALAQLASDRERAARMGAAGRARAAERFSREASRARWAEVLGGAVAAAAPGRRPLPAAPAQLPALVTVTHNSARQLRALLDSVERHLPGARTVVVDCASGDGTVEVAGASQSALTIPLDRNVGFGAACNRGVAAVQEPVTVVLNPDVELLDDSLLLLAAEATRADRPERLLAPLVLSPDGSRQDTVHPLPTSGADLLRSLVPPAMLPGRLAVAAAPRRATEPRPVGWAVGCALVARTETLRRLGPFDERIFLYGEDLELGLRAAGAGVRTWFWPTARVLHHRAHATAAAFGGEPFELLATARDEVVALRLGARRATVDRVAQALTFGSRLFLKRAVGRPAARERRQLEALRRVRRANGAA